MLLFEPTYYFELTVEHLPPPTVAQIHTQRNYLVYVGFQNRKKSVVRLFTQYTIDCLLGRHEYITRVPGI